MKCLKCNKDLNNEREILNCSKCSLQNLSDKKIILITNRACGKYASHVQYCRDNECDCKIGHFYANGGKCTNSNCESNK